MSHPTTGTHCATCGKDVRYHARSLCKACWCRAARAGTLDEHPRTYRRADDVLEDYEVLRSAGVELPTIAARLGYEKVDSLRAVLRRARRTAVTA